MGISDEFLQILALDPGASLKFSEHTGKWYVSAFIEIGDGTLLTSLSEHELTPEMAVTRYLSRLASVTYPAFVVTRVRGKRREWRWNGAAFAECTREEVAS